MATKILANDGGKMMGERLKQAKSGFGGFLVWLVLAIMFPYQVLTPYWAEAQQWGPVLLYLLAFFNLLKGIWRGNQAWGLRRPTAMLGRGKTPTAKQDAERAGRAEARAAKDQRRHDAMPQPVRPPTVQRMR